MSTTDSATNTISAATSTSRLEELGNQLKSIKASIADLEKTFKEASKEVSKSLKEASKNKRVKRVREGPYTPSAGQQAWNNYVATVRQELQKSNSGATYKDAMMEAKKRRAAGDKDAPVSTSASKKAPKAAKASAAIVAPVAAAAAPVVVAAAAPKEVQAKAAPKAKTIKA
jgi:chromosome segregation ATPase